MFLVQRLLKSSVKSYLSKFIDNEITLNQMEYKDGVFKLEDFYLNISELNKQLDNIPLIGNLGIMFAHIDCMKIYPSWDNVINKIEIDGVSVRVSKCLPQENLEKQELDTSTDNTSIFYYEGEESVVEDSAIFDQDMEGYRLVLDKVENIANDFVLQANNIQVLIDNESEEHFKIAFGFTYTQNKLSLKKIQIEKDTRILFYSRLLKMVLSRNGIGIETESCDANIKIEDIKEIIDLMSKIEVEKKDSSEEEVIEDDYLNDMYHSCRGRKNIGFTSDNFGFTLDDVTFNLKKLDVQYQNKNLQLNCDSILSNILNFEDLNFSLAKNEVPIFDNVFRTPFSDKACFYNGNKKPKSMANEIERELFKKEKKEKSKYHVSLECSDCNIDFQPLSYFVNKFLKLFDSKKSAAESDMIWWIEVDTKRIQIKYNQTLQFQGDNVSFYFADFYWCLDAANIAWISEKNLMNGMSFERHQLANVTDLHLAGNVPLNHLVEDVDRASIVNFTEIKAIISQFIGPTSEPLDIRIYLKLNSISCDNIIEIDDKPFGCHIDAIEIFNTNQSLNITAEHLKCVLENYPILVLQLFHINLFDQTFKNRNFDIRWNISKLDCNLDSEDFKSILNFASTMMVLPASHKKKKNELQLNFVDNYEGDDEEDSASISNEGIIGDWNVTLRQNYESKNHIKFHGSGFNINFPSSKEILDQRTMLTFPTFEIIDGVESSLWYKAFWTKNLSIVWLKDYLSVEAKNDLYLNIDQDFVNFIIQFFEWDVQQSFMVDNPPTSPTTQKPPFSSIHISELTFRLDYKPKDDGAEEVFEFINFMALRNSKILFREFYMFNIRTIDDLIQSITLNLVANIQNIQGVIAGMKPVQPIAKILSGAKNVIILPLNTKLDKNFGHKLKLQLKKVMSDTAIEVLQVGCGLNISLDGKKSIYSNQPATIKQGFASAEKEFVGGMKTVFAFVKSGEDADILTLPMAVIKPFTGGLSQILLGICNQLDPSRKQRMDNKYK